MIKKLSESSLPIALSAFGITLYYSEMLTQNIDFIRGTINFCATFFIYNFAILSPKLVHNPKAFRENKYQVSIGIISLFTLIPLIYCIQFIGILDLINYSHLFVLSLLYELPRKLKLRRLPYLKPFLISYIWTMAVVFPYYYDNIIVPSNIFIVEFFLFMLMLCLIFDFRDREIDTKENIKTFANMMEFKSFKRLTYALFTVSTFLTLFVFCKTPLYLFNLIAIFMTIYKLDHKKGYLYYLLIVDGLIFLRSLSLLYS